jgi:hypothetical protein
LLCRTAESRRWRERLGWSAVDSRCGGQPDDGWYDRFGRKLAGGWKRAERWSQPECGKLGDGGRRRHGERR